MKTNDREYFGNSNIPKWSLVILFFVVASLFLAGGYWFYQHEKDTVKTQAYNELKAIADLKADQIVAWRQERITDARLNSASRLLREAVKQLKDTPDDPALIEDILSNLRLLRNLQDYENVVLTAPGGRVLLTLDSRLTVLA
jgi:two-component system cell cycle sensor histidine kinase/response regulator CckA